jgi:hypothetical protein
MHRSRQALLARRLADERGRRVAFVSHCLLNENTRYLGGAFKAGAAPEIVTGLLEAGLGIRTSVPDGLCGSGHPWHSGHRGRRRH